MFVPSFGPPHTSSPTAHVLTELQLYFYRPFQNERQANARRPDPRRRGADIFGALASDNRQPPQRSPPSAPLVKDRVQLNTARGSRNASRPNVPYSRPMPDCLKPPKGASGSCGAELMTTRPACNCPATILA